MRRAAPPLAAALALLLFGAEAWARVGGGHTYGDGGSSYGGGGHGGGSDGEAVELLVSLLVRLVFLYPAVGIPAVIGIVVLCLLLNARSDHQVRAPISSRQRRAGSAPRARAGSRPTDALVQVDRNFSTPLLLDFVTLLYTRVHQERTGDLASLAGYLSPTVRQQLQDETRQRRVQEVQEVLVGSQRIVECEAGDPQRLLVDLEANFTERGASGLRPIYSRERWTLTRRAGVLSQPPETITRLACPSCGSPAELRLDGTCPYCEATPSSGAFAWVLTDIQVQSRSPRPRSLPHRGDQEAGTDLPTRAHPDLAARREAFEARHPGFSWGSLEGRATHIFMSLQAAWSQGRWELARPYETDALFATHRCWIETYARLGLANRVEDVRLTGLVLVNVEADAFFEAVTVRVLATARDWTEELASGRVVDGSKERPRAFSEYWTFLRREGGRAPRTRDHDRCPSCGAPLEIGMTGICGHCDTKVTTGDFDWVLTRIEQDEAFEI